MAVRLVYSNMSENWKQTNSLLYQKHKMLIIIILSTIDYSIFTDITEYLKYQKLLHGYFQHDTIMKGMQVDIVVKIYIIFIFILQNY